MTSQLRKKHPTTPRNTPLATSRKPQGSTLAGELRLAEINATTAARRSAPARWLLIGSLALFGLGSEALAGTNSSLQWGRPQIAKRADAPGAPQPTRLMQDSRVVTAAWEEEPPQTAFTDPSAGQPTLAAPGYEPPAYDPFEEDDRESTQLAQLNDDPFADPSSDPFDEPAGEELPIPESEEAPLESLEDVEAALEEELERRRTQGDPLGEDPSRALENDPLEEREARDPMGEEPDGLFEDLDKQLNDDNTDLDKLLQPDRDSQTPDMGFDETAGDEGLTAEELEEQRKALEEELRESKEGCREELANIEADLISSIDLNIRVEGNAGEDFPFECAVSSRLHKPRQWPEITYNWKASALCHKPLYFEQVQLERYGHSWGPYVQPIMSGVHFFGTVPILPYKMGIRTPTECVYTLGYYRPGSCAPYMIDPVPFTWRAALFQGSTVTGISFIIP